MTRTTHADLGDFVHPALFYRSQQDYLDSLVPFITDGLAKAQPVLVAVPAQNLIVLHDALGDAAAAVTMADMTEAGRNPGRILGAVLSSFADKHPHDPVRMIGEPIWASRSELEYPACVQHEALINHAFAGRDATVLCPYNAAELDENVLADARSTHPVLWQAGSEEDSASYAPDAVWERYNEPLAPSQAAVTYVVRTRDELSAARAFATEYAEWFGLSPGTTANLQLITNELATDSLQHAGSCSLAYWQHDGHLVCQVRNSGHLDDPLAGRRPYDSDTPRGRGMFVVNGAADLVRSHTGPDGTTVHAYLRLDTAA